MKTSDFHVPDQPSTQEFAPDLIASEPAAIKPRQTPILHDVRPEQDLLSC